jgi:hypothetical protein
LTFWGVQGIAIPCGAFFFAPTLILFFKPLGPVTVNTRLTADAVAVGVPLKMPIVGANVKPAGRVPVVSAQLHPAQPATPLRVIDASVPMFVEYAVPTVPCGKVIGETIVIVSGAATMVKVAVVLTTVPLEFDTLTWNPSPFIAGVVAGVV